MSDAALGMTLDELTGPDDGPHGTNDPIPSWPAANKWHLFGQLVKTSTSQMKRLNDELAQARSKK